MHTTIDYAKLHPDNPELQHEAALLDIQDYLTSAHYAKLTKDIKSCNPPMTYTQFLFACELAGISGFPVQAWAKECGIKRKMTRKSADTFECSDCGRVYDDSEYADNYFTDQCPADDCPSNALPSN